MKITIAEAAKYTPHNRQTLYAHAKQGKLTTTKDALGKTVVDTAELQRAYGKLTGMPAETPERQPETPQDTALVQVETHQDNTEIIALLKSQLDEARKREHHLLTALHSAQNALQTEQQKTERLMIAPPSKETPPQTTGRRKSWILRTFAGVCRTLV